jgi:hypothetical protein
MIEATLAERYRVPFGADWNCLPPLPAAAYPFLGYTVQVTWQDGWVCTWHVESLPDITLLEEMRPGVLSVHYSAD